MLSHEAAAAGEPAESFPQLDLHARSTTVWRYRKITCQAHDWMELRRIPVLPNRARVMNQTREFTLCPSFEIISVLHVYSIIHSSAHASAETRYLTLWEEKKCRSKLIKPAI